MSLLKTLKATIEQQDIDEAIRGKSNKCMIKHAIQRAYPHLQLISVEHRYVRATDPKENCIYTFHMSPFGRVQLLKFDAEEKVEPFTIRLTKPLIRMRTHMQSNGSPRVSSREDKADRSAGALRNPKTKHGRRMIGRDRVFGAKLHTEELRKLRESLEIKPKHPELPIESIVPIS